MVIFQFVMLVRLPGRVVYPPVVAVSNIGNMILEHWMLGIPDPVAGKSPWNMEVWPWENHRTIQGGFSSHSNEAYGGYPKFT